MSKPVQFPTWATAGTVTDPGAAKKAQGWIFEEEPPFDEFNWIHFTTYDWVRFLYDEMLSPIITDAGVLKADTVDTTQIVDDAVTSAKILNDNVTGEKIAPGVAQDGLQQDGNGNLFVGVDDVGIEISGDALRLKNLGVTNSKLAANSVGTTQIINDQVTAAKLNPDVAGNGISQGGAGALNVGGGAGLTANVDDVEVNVDDVGIEIVTDTLQLKADGVTGVKIAPAVAGNGLVQDGSGNLDVNVDDVTIEVATDTLQVKDAGIDETKVSGAVARWVAGCYVDMGSGVITAIELSGGNILGRSGNCVLGAATASAFGFAYSSTGITIITVPTGRTVSDYFMNVIAAVNGVFINGVVQLSSTTWRIQTYTAIGSALGDFDYHFQALRVS